MNKALTKEVETFNTEVAKFEADGKVYIDQLMSLYSKNSALANTPHMQHELDMFNTYFKHMLEAKYIEAMRSYQKSAVVTLKQLLKNEPSDSNAGIALDNAVRAVKSIGRVRSTYLNEGKTSNSKMLKSAIYMGMGGAFFITAAIVAAPALVIAAGIASVGYGVYDLATEASEPLATYNVPELGESPKPKMTPKPERSFKNRLKRFFKKPPSLAFSGLALTAIVVGILIPGAAIPVLVAGLALTGGIAYRFGKKLQKENAEYEEVKVHHEKLAKTHKEKTIEIREDSTLQIEASLLQQQKTKKIEPEKVEALKEELAQAAEKPEPEPEPAPAPAAEPTAAPVETAREMLGEEESQGIEMTEITKPEPTAEESAPAIMPEEEEEGGAEGGGGKASSSDEEEQGEAETTTEEDKEITEDYDVDEEEEEEPPPGP